MAEAIALIGSIAGLVDVSARVSIGLLKVARDIGEAGREIRSIARHTSVVSNVLNNLHAVMSRRGVTTTTSLRAELLVEDTLEHCMEILRDCEKLIQIFQPLIEKSGKKRTRVKLRLRMLFEKSKFVSHGDALEKVTGILTLLVTSMNYAQAVKTSSTEQTSASLRVQVESSITNVADSCQGRVNVTQLLTYHRSYEEQLSITQSSSASVKTEVSNMSLIDFDDPWTGTQLSGTTIAAEEITIKEISGNKTSSAVEVMAISQHVQQISESSKSELTRVSIQSVDDGEDYDEDELERELDEAFALQGLEDLLEPYMALKSLQRKTVQFAQGVLDTEISDDRASDVDEYSDARDVVEEVVVESQSGDEDDYDDELEVLRLRDVRGQIFNLPFSYAKTWEGVNVLLLEIYEHSPGYLNPVKLGDKQKQFQRRLKRPSFEGSPSTDSETILSLKPFQLYGPDGNPILPRVWPQVIEPGDLITMRFYDEKLNGPGAHPVTLAQKGSVWVRSWWWNIGPNGLARRRVKSDPKERIRFVRGMGGNESEESSGYLTDD